MTPLSNNAALVSRLLSPLAAARLKAQLKKTGKLLQGQPIELSEERYLVYRPATMPAAGYGLLVFVPPWEDARLPLGWAEVLDRAGMIFVTAAHSGNDEIILGRREPLALAAAYNVPLHYPVDSKRIYISGFSGGSRVALRLAIGYPDLFHGALLDAGSDPVGDAEFPLPQEGLLDQFQASSRLVFATGANDEINLEMDMGSRLALQHWCAFNSEELTIPRTGHEVLDGVGLANALRMLNRPLKPDIPKIERCMSARRAELHDKLERVRTLKANGDLAAARKLLRDIDDRFGGLATGTDLDLRDLSLPDDSYDPHRARCSAVLRHKQIARG